MVLLRLKEEWGDFSSESLYLELCEKDSKEKWSCDIGKVQLDSTYFIHPRPRETGIDNYIGRDLISMRVYFPLSPYF